MTGRRSWSRAADGSGCRRTSSSARGSGRGRGRRSPRRAIVVSPAGESAEPVSAGGDGVGPVARVGGTVVAGVRGVGMRYGEGPRETVVLEGLEADFSAGRLTALTGPSGSGKTTLLHILAGLRDPSAGTVSSSAGTLADARPRGARRAPARRDRVHRAGPGTDAVPQRARERRGRTRASGGRARRGAAARARCSRRGRARRAGRAARRRDSRPESGSAWRSPARSPPRRSSCSPTSRRPGSTRRTHSRSARSSGAIARETGAAVVCATHDPLVVGEADDVLAL